MLVRNLSRALNRRGVYIGIPNLHKQRRLLRVVAEARGNQYVETGIVGARHQDLAAVSRSVRGTDRPHLLFQKVDRARMHDNPTSKQLRALRVDQTAGKEVTHSQCLAIQQQRAQRLEVRMELLGWMPSHRV